MNLTKNELIILKLLMDSTHYLSSYEIATATSINRRSVREVMITLKKKLEKININLISQTSKGYLLDIFSLTQRQKLKKIIETNNNQESLYPTLPNERQNYIIKRLIEANTYLKVDDLADELLVSRSTLLSDLKQAKLAVRKYHLKMKQKPNYGVCIEGNEIDKRKPVIDFLFTNLNESNMVTDYLYSFIFSKNTLEYGIIQILNQNHIYMSDYGLCDFLLTLTFQLARVAQHIIVKQVPDSSITIDQHTLQVAKTISNYIQTKTNVSFTHIETINLAISIQSKRSTLSQPIDNNDLVNHLSSHIFQSIKDKTFIQFSKEVQNHFKLYIKNALLRLSSNEKIRNPVYNTINIQYPLAYYLSSIASSVFEDYGYNKLSSSELAYFSMFFHEALFNIQTKSYYVLLICGLGSASTKLVKFLIEDKFKDKLIIKDTCAFHLLPNYNINNYDFIISTIPIHQKMNKTIINISPLINEEDYMRIENYLNLHLNPYELHILFHPCLYFSLSLITNLKELNDYLYTHLKRTKIINLKNGHFIHYENKLSLFILRNPLQNTKQIITITFDSPIKLDNHSISILLIVSFPYESINVLNQLQVYISHLSDHPIIINQIVSKHTYTYFLKKLLYNKNSL